MPDAGTGAQGPSVCSPLSWPRRKNGSPVSKTCHPYMDSRQHLPPHLSRSSRRASPVHCVLLLHARVPAVETGKVEQKDSESFTPSRPTMRRIIQRPWKTNRRSAGSCRERKELIEEACRGLHQVSVGHTHFLVLENHFQRAFLRGVAEDVVCLHDFRELESVAHKLLCVEAPRLNYFAASAFDCKAAQSSYYPFVLGKLAPNVNSFVS